MKKIIRKIAKKIGFVSTYRVTCFFPDENGGNSYLCLTVSIRPWLNEENYLDLVSVLQEKSGINKQKPYILNITKLGI